MVSGATAGEAGPGPVPAAGAAADAPAADTAADTAAADGCPAGHEPGRSPSAAYPTPIWRWRSSPDRNATTTGTSSGLARRSSAEISSILARRPDVAVTASDV